LTQLLSSVLGLTGERVAGEELESEEQPNKVRKKRKSSQDDDGGDVNCSNILLFY
jgi:hypothetical protein